MRTTLPNGWLMCDDAPLLPPDELDALDFPAFIPCKGKSTERILEKHARTSNGMKPDLLPVDGKRKETELEIHGKVSKMIRMSVQK